MCGICGVFDYGGSGGVGKDTIEGMCDVITHRGPDESGIYLDKDIGLGHRRLSIIDLSSGRQPIHNEDESVWISYNGEVYNHEDLRTRLEDMGHSFSTHTDTEAIVHLYEEFGITAFSQLNGMFAIALWDSMKETLYLVRDMLGIKPLYYTLTDKKIVFGSELKAILQYPGINRKVDLSALDEYLTLNYILAPKTIFEGIRKLQPGRILKVGREGASETEFWKLSHKTQNTDPQHHIDEVRRLLADSVKIRLMSDVPLGAFLSGGIDSSAVVAFMSQASDKPVKTFTMGFADESFSEIKYARIVSEAFGTEHHELIVEPDAVELVGKLVEGFDEPFADYSAIPTYMVSELARKHVKVCLSGDGGDESFGGYDRYAAVNASRYLRVIPKPVRYGIKSVVDRLPVENKDGSIVKRAKRFLEACDLPEKERYISWVTIFSQKEREQLYAEGLFENIGLLDSAHKIEERFNVAGVPDIMANVMYADLHTYLPGDLLVKVDRTSMMHSLEVRVPFLDHRLVEYATTIPSSLKVHGLALKYLFKTAMSGVLPDEILVRRKHGFSVPLGSWFRGELSGVVDDILGNPKAKYTRYFRGEEVKKIVDQHRRRARDNTHKIWAILMFELWHRRYIDGEKISGVL